MARRADIKFHHISPAQYQGAGTNYPIQTPTGVLYQVLIDNGTDTVFIKSTDGGLTWSAATVVYTGTVNNLSVWYDRWSGIPAGLIHCAYTQTSSHDTFYRTINTESSDALSTETTIFAGTSAASPGGHISIARARGGNVYCKTCIDAGVEGGFFRLPNANVPNGAWDAAKTIDEALATTDQMILLPSWNADTQDMMAFFWDASADEISRKLYDDSANSWAETSISTGMVDNVPGNAFPHFAATVDLTNSRNILVAWNGIDTANADLLGWIVTESAITAFTTPVVLNGTDDQGLCAIGLDTVTGWWLVVYAGKSDGSETWPTAFNFYCKVSKDTGATWGPETKMSTAIYVQTRWLATIPRFTGGFKYVTMDDTSLAVYYTGRINIDVVQPRARAIVMI